LRQHPTSDAFDPFASGHRAHRAVELHTDDDADIETGQSLRQCLDQGADRIDKWLWHARFFKSRSLASKVCHAGRVRVDGAVVWKAHFHVRPGQVLTFAQGDHVRVVRVLALADRRGPSSAARELYADLKPPTAENAVPSLQMF
jgi:ribosome-associated heat shock protein Hsp15